MDINLGISLIRRREEMYNFYYRGIGDRVKKRRKQLRLTQESLAKGICSNTYISKIENNKIVINKEHLFLIMERMGLPIDHIGFPEKMLEYLEKSIRLFFYKDLESYKELYEEVSKYEYGILVFIVRLGYYILFEDFENAQTIYNDMYRYLSSLEDFGFATFLIYGCFYNVGINDFQTARIILESIKDNMHNDEMLFGLYSYLKFVVYGNLNLINYSRDALDVARNVFMSYGNTNRMNDTLVISNTFKAIEGSYKTINFEINQLSSLTKSERNYYLIILGHSSGKILEYLDYLDPKGDNYLTGLYLKANYLFNNKKFDEYKEVKKEINDLHYQHKAQLDFGNILKLEEDSDKSFLKDYLINYVLSYAVRIQNIYIMKEITNQIVDILANKKRYKDALNYYRKCEATIYKLQTHKKITT
ncbi:helix-turn-helix transcriptional regulator [Mycoplasmatota bacterium WC30]